MQVGLPRFGGIIRVPHHGQPHGALAPYNRTVLDNYIKQQHPGVEVTTAPVSYVGADGKTMTQSSELPLPIHHPEWREARDCLTLQLTKEGNPWKTPEADITAIEFLKRLDITNLSLEKSLARHAPKTPHHPRWPTFKKTRDKTGNYHVVVQFPGRRKPHPQVTPDSAYAPRPAKPARAERS